MNNRVLKDDIRNCLKNGMGFLSDLAIEIYGETINKAGEEAFSKAVEVGIENTIAALYDAKVEDNEILRVVVEHWGINKEDALDRLVWEKQQAVIRNVKQYLKLQGYMEIEIRNYMKKNKVISAIRYNKELWRLKDNPKKVLAVIENSTER